MGCEPPVERRRVAPLGACNERAPDGLKLVEHRSPPCFGRMRGERRANLETLDQRLHLVGGNTGRMERMNGLADRLGAFPLAGPRIALPVRAHDLLLFGRVDELEENRVSAQEALRKIGLPQLGHALEKSARIGLVAFGVEGARDLNQIGIRLGR